MTNLDKVFKQLEGMDLTISQEIKLIKIIGELARNEYREGCEATREILL